MKICKMNVARRFKEAGIVWNTLNFKKLKWTIINFIKYSKFNEEKNSASHFIKKCEKWKFLRN